MAKYVETTIKEITCPDCESPDVVKHGVRNGQQRYRCQDCEKAFRDADKAQGRRIPSEVSGAAIRMFYSGMSYKQIAESLSDMYDIPEPSKATVYEWVRDYTKVASKEMEQHPAHVGKHWVADEMQLTVGGQKYWNWNVMDEDSRYILASHLSKERNGAAATAVMEKAKANAAATPETIKTDKLRSYIRPIKAVFPEVRHVQSEGLTAALNNNRSERLQGTFRQRTKTLRGLENLETGQLYLDGWTLTYNLFKEHEGLEYQTPGEVAKVSPPFKEWADVTGMHEGKVRIRRPKVQQSSSMLNGRRVVANKDLVAGSPLPRRRKQSNTGAGTGNIVVRGNASVLPKAV